MTTSRNIDRARVYRFLARTFQPPDPSRVSELQCDDLPGLPAVLKRLGASVELLALAKQLDECLLNADTTSLNAEYDKAFEVSNGAERPPNETAHAPETPQEELTKTYQLADIAGFYRAFGVEVEPGSERVDHIAAELEFMHLLAVKEALAKARDETEKAEICRDGAASFLRDHLGRWCAKLCAQLQAESGGQLYQAAGELLVQFVKLDIEDRKPPCRMA